MESTVDNSPSATMDLNDRLSYTEDADQYLTFSLGQELFGIEILRVQEIKGYSPVTPVPNGESYVKGVMNLRGTIMPVLDLRARLSLSETEYNKFTVIIVLKVGEKIMGMIVDAVSDVLNLPESCVQAPPEIAAEGVESRFVRGIATSGERLVMLLNIDKVMSASSCG